MWTRRFKNTLAPTPFFALRACQSQAFAEWVILWPCLFCGLVYIFQILPIFHSCLMDSWWYSWALSDSLVQVTFQENQKCFQQIPHSIQAAYRGYEGGKWARRASTPLWCGFYIYSWPRCPVLSKTKAAGRPQNSQTQWLHGVGSTSMALELDCLKAALWTEKAWTKWKSLNQVKKLEPKAIWCSSCQHLWLFLTIIQTNGRKLQDNAHWAELTVYRHRTRIGSI